MLKDFEDIGLQIQSFASMLAMVASWLPKTMSFFAERKRVGDKPSGAKSLTKEANAGQRLEVSAHREKS